MQKTLLQTIASVFMLLLVASCSTTNDVASGNRLVKRKYTKGYHLTKVSKSPLIKANSNEIYYSNKQTESVSAYEAAEINSIQNIEPEKTGVEILNASAASQVLPTKSLSTNHQASKRKRKIATSFQLASKVTQPEPANATDDELPDGSIKFNFGRFLWHFLVGLAGVLAGITLGSLAAALVYFSSIWQDSIEMPRKPAVADATYVFKASFVIAFKATFALFMVSGLIYLLAQIYLMSGLGALIGILLAILILFLLLSAVLDEVGDFCMPFLFIGWGR